LTLSSLTLQENTGVYLNRNNFKPWVQREMYGEGWSVFGLIAFGRRIEGALKCCPRTAALLTHVPGLTTAGFSRLEPGTHIKPHVGWVSTVYRLHMGLLVPPDCAMRVGGETRSWSEGECLIFDDTLEHEAWNRSSETRVVLLLDFLRPGVTDTTVDLAPPEVEAAIQRRIRS
jgi:beta-hydroxylase